MLHNKWILLLVLALVWGSSFVLISMGLETFTAMQLGALRLVFACMFLFPLMFKNLKHIPKNKWIWVAISGICGNCIPMFLFPIAEEHISSSLAGILNSLVPLFVVVLGFILFNVKNTKRQILGTFIGFLGAFFLIVFKDFDQAFTFSNIVTQIKHLFSGENNMIYSLFVVLATILYAINVLVLKKHLSQIPSFPLSTIIFGFLFLPSLLIAWQTDVLQTIPQENFTQGLVYVALLGIFGTAVSMILFYKLIQISSSVFASSVTYIMPLVALFWGVIFNEPITYYLVIGACVILLGIYLIKGKKKAEV